MKLGGVGVTLPTRHGPFQLRLKFGKQHYCVIELRPGDEAVGGREEAARTCRSGRGA